MTPEKQKTTIEKHLIGTALFAAELRSSDPESAFSISCWLYTHTQEKYTESEIQYLQELTIPRVYH